MGYRYECLAETVIREKSPIDWKTFTNQEIIHHIDLKPEKKGKSTKSRVNYKTVDIPINIQAMWNITFKNIYPLSFHFGQLPDLITPRPMGNEMINSHKGCQVDLYCARDHNVERPYAWDTLCEY